MSADFLSAVIDGLETVGPWALWWCATTTAVVAVVAGCRAGAAVARRRRRVPAAPDNQPGTDPELLWACRRIADQPTASRKEKPRP